RARLVERLDLPEREPVVHAVLPAEGLVVDGAGAVGVRQLGDRHRPLVAVGDVHGPRVAGVLAACRRARVVPARGRRGVGIVAVDDDGGAAFLAADLDYLADDLLVRDGVFGL